MAAPRVFLSYSSKDAAFSDRLEADLKATCYISPRSFGMICPRGIDSALPAHYPPKDGCMRSDGVDTWAS